MNSAKSESICKILTQMLKSGPLKGKMKLPSTRLLAKQLGTSRVTIINAIKLLEKDGQVFRKSRSGIYIANPSEFIIPADGPENEIKRKSAEDIALAIQEDIQQGKFKVGSFVPMQKFLAFQYRTSRGTIQKSLKLLLERGQLHRSAGRWIAGAKFDVISHRATRKNIYLIGTKPPEQREYDSVDQSLFFHSFEEEMQKYGVSSIEYVAPENNREWMPLTRESSTAGFFILPGLWESDVKILQKILFDFSKTACPLVISHYNALKVRYPLLTPVISHNMFLLWYSEKKLINTIASYLASLGHKKIACFITFFGEEDKNTLLLMCQRFGYLAGEKTESHFFDMNERGLPDLSPLNIKMISRKIIDSMSPLFWNHKFKKVDPLENAYLPLSRTVREDLLMQYAPPYFEEALKTGATVWICQGEFSAEAAKYLSKKNIAVPKEISLMAFHSTPRTEGLDITAFDMCHDRMGYMAAHCILGDIPMQKNRNNLVEFEWKFWARKTVGPAREENTSTTLSISAK